jgi:hypothetical protein
MRGSAKRREREMGGRDNGKTEREYSNCLPFSQTHHIDTFTSNKRVAKIGGKLIIIDAITKKCPIFGESGRQEPGGRWGKPVHARKKARFTNKNYLYSLIST